MEKEKKNYRVNLIKNSNLTFTGKGLNNIWEQSEVLDDFSSPWDETKHSKIEFRSLWDENYFFFYFKVYDTEIFIDTTDDSLESIGKSDRVELFFRSDASLNPYYCLEIDTSARVMDFKAYPNKKFDFNWNWPTDQLQVKSSKDETSFTVEGTISISSLKQLGLIHENKMEVGIFRAKYNATKNLQYEPIWISWVNPNTEEPNFHIATSFGTLNLMTRQFYSM